jgi:hypothetical protein
MAEAQNTVKDAIKKAYKTNDFIFAMIPVQMI